MRSAAAITSHGKSEMARPIPPGYQSYSRRQPAINFSEHSILRNLPEAFLREPQGLLGTSRGALRRGLKPAPSSLNGFKSSRFNVFKPIDSNPS